MAEETEHVRAQTIEDFSDQWAHFSDNQGYHASVENYQDMLGPLYDLRQEMPGKRVADIGSGTGRTVNVFLQCDAKTIYAIEPSEHGFKNLQENTAPHKDRIEYLNIRGDQLPADLALDEVFVLYVLHHIVDAPKVMEAGYRALKPGGRMIIWLYGYEGIELYVWMVNLLRPITIRTPHSVLLAFSRFLVWMTDLYTGLCRWLPLPLKDYFLGTFSRFDCKSQVMVIYDQLNPKWAKYYKKDESEALMHDAGFKDVKTHHHRGYSWTVCGTKPLSEGDH